MSPCLAFVLLEESRDDVNDFLLLSPWELSNFFEDLLHLSDRRSTMRNGSVGFAEQLLYVHAESAGKFG
jgi:hypothetical protein